MSKYVLGIDQGTTGTTVIVFDEKANIISSAYSEFTQFFPNPGWVEHDANEIYEVVLRVSKEALDKKGIAPSDIAAIGITNQRETTVFWDKNTGRALCPSIVWQDIRTAERCDELIKKDGEDIMARTGMIIVTNCAGPKIEWVMKNNEEVRKGIEAGDVLFGTVDSWLVWKLSGKAAHVTDYSNSGCTLLLNQVTLDYDEKMLKELGIPRSILPELRYSSEVYANTDPAEFFGASVPISGIAGDQQSALFGQGCLFEGMAKNTYGTGSFMILNTGKNYKGAQGGTFSDVLCTQKGEIQYGLEGMANVSGAAIQWLRDGLGIINEADECEKLAMTVEDNGGVYFVPAFNGLGSPYSDPYARGTIIGITRGTTKGHVCRAALECMAFQVAEAFHDMEELSGTKITALRVDGGGAKSDYMCQFQADILGVPVARPVITETTCLGAAYLAGLAVGYYKSVQEVADNWQIERLFEPQVDEARREELMDGWRRAVERSGNWIKKA
ncbi:MAG: glycerol kinase GlpK [Oscillospiraceae bacterium]|nr:glycerol kinase GlpK [Oscillospiraceae bacterium]